MTLRQKALMEQSPVDRAVGCDPFLGFFGNATRRYEHHELGETGGLSYLELEAPPGFERGMEVLQTGPETLTC